MVGYIVKRVNNIYDTIIDLKKLDLVYKQVKNNTKNKVKLLEFENNYVSNMIYIKNILEEKKYRLNQYNIFIIKEPKTRLIMSLNITDKIVNNLISNYFLIDIFDKTLIDENVATRKNKGTHYGIKKLKQYLNELKGEDFYILKFDITKYFFNIDHSIIKKLIRKKIKDKDVLKLLDTIIDSTNEDYINEMIKKLKKREISKTSDFKKIKEIESLPEYKFGKGLPIGNMSSQLLAILYLNELDRFIKEKLKIKYYLRYMDDGIILHKDKEYLKYCLDEITKILTKYKLELNDKTKIINIKNGFEFLGFKYFIKNNKVLMKVTNQTKRKFKRKIKNLNSLVLNNKLDIKYLNQVKASYLGHLKYGNTNKLIKTTLECKKKINIIMVFILNKIYLKFI